MRRLFLIAALAITLIVGTVGVATAQGGTTIYIVAQGDTLARIAARFDTTVYEIAALNGLNNVNLIYVGQQLVIPNPYTPPPAPPPQPPPPQQGGGYYVVQRGDTLRRIAEWYNTTVYAIQQANGIINPNRIFVGQLLYIPPSSPPPPTYITAYHVRPGDTLRRIAAAFGTTVQAIVAYNNLANPNVIFAGQLLYIPHY
ncbi:MAG: LysM peptidoglycan-binding domain-containing protein [bacterium]|nr:LysM peptidoglycan-binding domain-containing protein [bacterium]